MVHRLLWSKHAVGICGRSVKIVQKASQLGASLSQDFQYLQYEPVTMRILEELRSQIGDYAYKSNS